MAALMVIFLQDLWKSPAQVQTISYSEFQQLVAKDAVTDVIVGQTTITGTYKNPAKDGPQQFATVRVDPNIADELQEQNIKFTGEPPPGFLDNVLSWFLPTIGFILLWMLLLRPMVAGARAPLYTPRAAARLHGLHARSRQPLSQGNERSAMSKPPDQMAD